MATKTLNTTIAGLQYLTATQDDGPHLLVELDVPLAYASILRMGGRLSISILDVPDAGGKL